MKRRKKENLIGLMGILVLSGMLAACGSGETEETGSRAAARTEAAGGTEAAAETEADTETESESESESRAENIMIKESPDKYTWYMQNYVGLNLANVGYTSLGGDRLDKYGAGTVELCLVTDDGSYIDISSQEDLQQYVVAAQSLEPNTEIKYTFQVDSNGEEYDNLVAWQNIEQIDLLLKHVGSELSPSAPELVEITPSPDKYTSYIRNYVGKNAALVGYESMSGKRMDAYGGGYLELVLATDDGTYLDPSDTAQLSQYIITGQNIAPNTQLTMTFLKDSSGEEYDNLVDTQNYESITLNLKKTGNAAAGTAAAASSQTKTAAKSTGGSSSGTGSSGTGSSGTGSSGKDSNGVSLEFKETMDAYEAFFDEYVEFMQDYDATDLGQLTEYAELMTTYAEYMQEMSDLENEDLSDADYAYYVEVNSRILKKLQTVS